MISSPHIHGVSVCSQKENDKVLSFSEGPNFIILSLRVLCTVVCELFLLPFWGGKNSEQVFKVLHG